MINVEQLSRSYDDFIAVNQVSFHINPGEIVGLLGHNGAGKTTIMKMLTGFLEPSAGTITVDGVNVAENANKVQQQLGYLPENQPLYPEMSVIDYLDFAAHLRGVPEDQCSNAVLNVIKQTGLKEKAFDPIATLSRGYKQRVGVAQAILHQPKLLILDEPTNGLDPSQTHQMRDLIKQLSAHSTVILSTHIMQEVDAICDRVLILNNGRLAVDESMEMLRQTNRIQLTTDIGEAKIQTLLNKEIGIESVTCTHSDSDKYQYSIQLASDQSLDQAATETAKRLITGNHAVYTLAPELRDLETVFREVNKNEEVAHAA